MLFKEFRALPTNLNAGRNSYSTASMAVTQQPADARPDDKLHEECGVVAIHGHPDAARQAYLGLYALQHRGQESAGIATADGQHLANIKGMGLVSEIFTDEVLQKLPGHDGDRPYALLDDRRLGTAECAAYSRGFDQGADCDCAQRQPGEPGQCARAA